MPTHDTPHRRVQPTSTPSLAPIGYRSDDLTPWPFVLTLLSTRLRALQAENQSLMRRVHELPLTATSYSMPQASTPCASTRST